MKTMGTMTGFSILGAMAVALTLPVAANADPPAVGAPTIPAVFVGAPTNDNPNAGEFTVNFDSTGSYQGVGIAPEPPLTRDVTPERDRAQSRANAPVRASERDSVNHLFAHLASQLRDQASPQAASLGR